MAIDRSSHKKAPSQNPVDFAMSKQQGGAYGKPQNVPDVLKSGPQREKVFGKKK